MPAQEHGNNQRNEQQRGRQAVVRQMRDILVMGIVKIIGQDQAVLFIRNGQVVFSKEPVKARPEGG